MVGQRVDTFLTVNLEVDKYDEHFIAENSLDECILKIDLEYSEQLRELHNDNLLAPEKQEINHDMLSNYCSNIAN